MFIPLASAAAIALAGASPAPRLLFTPDDYPDWALQSSASAGAFLHFVQDPTGKFVECRVLDGVGNRRLAMEFCAILKRKKLKRTDSSGNGRYIVQESYFTMTIDGTLEAFAVMTSDLQGRPNATASVSSLPDGRKNALVTVILQVDANGQVTDCKAATDPRQDLADLPVVACQMEAAFNGSIYKAPNGQAVPYETSRRILFAVK